MAIERYKPDNPNCVMFSYLTPAEGLEALKIAVDMVAGQCGDLRFIRHHDGARGFVGFALHGNINALAGLAQPWMRREITDALNITDDQLAEVWLHHTAQHGWFNKPAEATAK